MTDFREWGPFWPPAIHEQPQESPYWIGSKPEKKLGNRNIWRTYSKEIRNNGVKNELDKIKQLEEEIKQKNLIYRTNKYKKDFQQHETLRSFGESSYAGKITVDEAEEDQSNLLKS